MDEEKQKSNKLVSQLKIKILTDSLLCFTRIRTYCYVKPWYNGVFNFLSSQSHVKKNITLRYVLIFFKLIEYLIIKKNWNLYSFVFCNLILNEFRILYSICASIVCIHRNIKYYGLDMTQLCAIKYGVKSLQTKSN